MIKIFFKKIFFIWAMLMLLEACTPLQGSSDSLVGLNIGKKGNSATINFDVSWLRLKMTRDNPQEVALMVLSPAKNDPAYLFEKYKSLYKDLTGRDYIYNGDVAPISHRGIRVRVTWKDGEGRIIRQKVVYSDNGNSKIRVTYGASFTLDAINLTPGKYSVTVESLDDDPRFDGTFMTGICTGYIAS